MDQVNRLDSSVFPFVVAVVIFLHQLIWSVGGVYGLPTAGERDMSSLFSLLAFATGTIANVLRAYSFKFIKKSQKNI